MDSAVLTREVRSRPPHDPVVARGPGGPGNNLTPIAWGALLVAVIFAAMVWLLVAGKSSGATATTSAVRVEPTIAGFGAQVLGTVSPATTVMVRNQDRSHRVSIRSVQVSGADASDFVIDATTCQNATLPPGQSCTVAVRFSPTAVGKRQAELVVDRAGLDVSLSVPLTGQAQMPPLVAAPTGVDFATVGVGGAGFSQTITATNDSARPVVVQAVAVTGDEGEDFSLPGETGCTGETIAPGGTCAVTVAFSPTAIGDRFASLMVSYAGSSNPLFVSLTGTGANLLPSASPAAEDFGPQPIGEASAPAEVTISPPAGVSLTIASVALAGANAAQFSLLSDTCAGTTLTAPATCTIGVEFLPASAGEQLASLVVTRAQEVSGVIVTQLTGFGSEPRLTRSVARPSDRGSTDPRAAVAHRTTAADPRSKRPIAKASTPPASPARHGQRPSSVPASAAAAVAELKARLSALRESATGIAGG